MLFFLKAITSILAAAYGIYATVTNFHEERDGRKVLSRGGKRGIVFLVLVSCLGIGVDLWKEKESNTSGAAAAETLARALDPLDQRWQVFLDIVVDPHEPEIHAYGQRIEHQYPRGDEDYIVDFTPPEKGFPNDKIKGESLLAELAHFQEVALGFAKKGPKSNLSAFDTSSHSEFALIGHCGPSEFSKPRKFFKKVEYKGEDIDLDIYCRTAEVDVTLTKNIRSYRDLDGADAILRLDMMDTSSRKDRHNQFDGIKFEIIAYIENETGSRTCSLRTMKPTNEIDRYPDGTQSVMVTHRSSTFRGTAICD